MGGAVNECELVVVVLVVVTQRWWWWWWCLGVCVCGEGFGWEEGGRGSDLFFLACVSTRDGLPGFVVFLAVDHGSNVNEKMTTTTVD